MSNHAIQTVLSKAAFPGKPKKQNTPLDIDGVQRCRDPYKPERFIQDRKYDALFANAADGDCWRVPGSVQELNAFARALRVHLKRNDLDGIVRQESRTADGINRVWLLKVRKATGCQ